MQRNFNMQIKYLVDLFFFLEVTLNYKSSNVLKIWLGAHTNFIQTWDL